MSAFVLVIALSLFVIAFGTGLLFLTSLVGPRSKTLNSVKAMPYECGIAGQETRETRVSVRFYLTAILFILFDIEIVFFYPWALVFKNFLASQPELIFFEMITFVGVLVLGLLYVWRAGALEWE